MRLEAEGSSVREEDSTVVLEVESTVTEVPLAVLEEE